MKKKKNKNMRRGECKPQEKRQKKKRAKHGEK